jgi:hypothetical protein
MLFNGRWRTRNFFRPLNTVDHGFLVTKFFLANRRKNLLFHCVLPFKTVKDLTYINTSMVLKTFFKRIRSRQRSVSSKQSRNKNGIQHTSSTSVSEKPEVKSAEQELREDYQELVRSSFRITRCLGDDLESVADSASRVSRQWSATRSVVVTHLLDDSDDEGGLRNAPSEDESIFINLDECRDNEDTTYINLDECTGGRD